MKRFLFVLTLILAAVTSPSCQATLIITIPTAEGVLIVSDRLRQNKYFGDMDDTAKVVRLATNAAFAVTGTVGFTLSHGGEVSRFQSEGMVAFDLAKAYFATNVLKPFDVVQFANCMRDGYSNHLAFYHLNISNRDFGNGCQFIFVRVDPSKDRHIFTATLAPARTGKTMGFTINCQQVVLKDTDSGIIGAYGQAELPIEILRGHDPRFADIRNNPIITKFFPHPPLVKKIELSDAQAFGHYLITEASEKTKLLNPKAAIGTNLDETLLVP